MATNGKGQDRTALVLYATETGTSQDLAEEIARLLERLRFSVDLIEADDAALSDLNDYGFSVFAISTTGQGDFPTNSRKFWASLLKRKLRHDTLADVTYALLGLGDSSYPKFNWAARKLDKRLHQLGAMSLLEACEADEQDDDGTDGTFLQWLVRLQEQTLKTFPLPPSVEILGTDIDLASKWHLARSDSQAATNGIVSSTNIDFDHRALPGAFEANLSLNQRMTPSQHWQDVRMLTLESLSHIHYLPGDALAILPKNSQCSVHQMISLMRWEQQADQQIHFEAVGPSARTGKGDRLPLPNMRSFTLQELLQGYLDINAIPRRSFFAKIVRYTDDEAHKERLLEFTNPEYLDEYYDYATRPRRSILEVLQEFHSVKIPWQEAANVLPLMRARQFSIASGGDLKPSGTGSKFELLIAIVKYRTVIKRIRQGICSNYLANLGVGSTLRVVLKTEGRFYTKTTDFLRPHLLIGPGTGVAPLRAMLHEMMSVAKGELVTTSVALFYGSRNSQADYFFRDEWQTLRDSDTKDGKLDLSVITAFSRDQREKIYVQDRIREAADRVATMIQDQHCAVIVCGSSGQMPKAVHKALLDCLTAPGSEARQLDRENAELVLQGMEKNGRYKQETWS